MNGPEVWCDYSKLVEPGALKPNPRNPNTHTGEQVRLAIKVITANGWRAPIVVSARSGYITRGHLRCAAARAAGWDSVPVDEQDYADEAAEMADMLADNRLGMLALLDPAQVVENITALFAANANFDLEGTGYTAATYNDVAALVPDANQIPVPPVPPDARGGSDWRSQWRDMPEFAQQNLDPYRALLVCFLTPDDLAAFLELVGQRVTDKTRSIWYPAQPATDTSTMAVSDES
jgi:hypothetical protein